MAMGICLFQRLKTGQNGFGADVEGNLEFVIK